MPAPQRQRAAVDTGALLALASSRDQYHARAVETATRGRRTGMRWIASTLVLGELHGHLLRRAGAATARRVLSALLKDPAYEWHDASADLIDDATIRWLDRFTDQ